MCDRDNTPIVVDGVAAGGFGIGAIAVFAIAATATFPRAADRNGTGESACGLETELVVTATRDCRDGWLHR